jgi:hypothetical protein
VGWTTYPTNGLHGLQIGGLSKVITTEPEARSSLRPTIHAYDTDINSSKGEAEPSLPLGHTIHFGINYNSGVDSGIVA